jgi:hypothetical protein
MIMFLHNVRHAYAVKGKRICLIIGSAEMKAWQPSVTTLEINVHTTNPIAK